MDLGSIFLILALIVLVGLFISRPFFNQPALEKAAAGSAAMDGSEQRWSALLAERDRLLNALQELDFDQGLGKIPAEDYPVQRLDLTQRTASVLRELDRSQASSGSEEPEDWVERAVAARRADSAAAVHGSAGKAAKDDVEELIAVRRNQRQERSAGFCPQCGKPVQKSDRFCSRCGQTQ